MDIDALITELGAEDVTQRRAAAERFSRNGAASAVMPLIQACADSDEEVQEFASSALEALGPPPLDVASQLAAQVSQPGPSGYWAATLLGRLQADAAQWATALGRAVQENTDSSVRQRAAWALGQIGPAATAGIPALEAATQEADTRLARLATEALKRVDTATQG